MIHANYYEPASQVYRQNLNTHFIKCDECGNTVCNEYVKGKDLCRYLGDNCFGGDKYDDGIFCHYCR